MGGPGSSGRAPVRHPSEAQAHVTTFWNTVAAGYEAHGGNVAKYGSAQYQRWVDALASVLPAPRAMSSMWRVVPVTLPSLPHPSATV